MTRTTDEPAGLFDRPCIAAFTTDARQFTVAEYDALQRQRYDQPCGRASFREFSTSRQNPDGMTFGSPTRRRTTHRCRL
jgi:hypothetical protein